MGLFLNLWSPCFLEGEVIGKELPFVARLFSRVLCFCNPLTEMSSSISISSRDVQSWHSGSFHSFFWTSQMLVPRCVWDQRMNYKNLRGRKVLAVCWAGTPQGSLPLSAGYSMELLVFYVRCVACLHSWTISRKWASCTAKPDRALRRRCTTMKPPAQPLRNSFSCLENEFGSKDLRSIVRSLTPKVRNTQSFLLGLFSSCCVDVHLLNYRWNSIAIYGR